MYKSLHQIIRFTSFCCSHRKCNQVLQLSAHFLPKTLCNQLFSRSPSDSNSSELPLCCLLASVASRYNTGESTHVRVATSTYTCTDPCLCARYRKCRTELQEDSKLHQKGDALSSTLTSAEMSVPPATSIRILTHVDFKTRTSKQNPLLIPTPFQNSRATFLKCLDYIYLPLISHLLHYQSIIPLGLRFYFTLILVFFFYFFRALLLLLSFSFSHL